MKLMPITQIMSEYDSNEYSAELLLNHAIEHLRQQNELASACRWAQTQIGKHTRPSPIDKALELIERGNAMNCAEVFTSQIIRLNRFQIGIGEARVLFSIGEGATKFDIAKKTGLEPEGARAVIGKLRTKGACRTVYDEQGNARYVLTDDGKRIISETLNGKKKP